MDAIAGIIDFTGAPVPQGELDRMHAALVPRLRLPPQSSIGDGVALGFHPVSAADGRVLVAHGDAADALLLHAQHGDDTPDRLPGDFALALWDPATRRLLCARDHYGMKPFHYHWDGRRFSFASDLNALLTLPWIDRRLNEGMVAEWLAVEWHAPNETLWEGIFRLRPGHRLVVTDRGPVESRWWHPDLTPIRSGTDADWVAQYRDLLDTALRRACPDSQPAAFEVSGGLDSSALFALAAHQGHTPLRGYTLDFPAGTAAHESPYAKALATHLGQAIVTCAPSRPLPAWYRAEAARSCDYPGLPNSTMALGLRARAAHDGARIIVSGSGGDEWLETSGARPFRQWLRRIAPSWIRRQRPLPDWLAPRLRTLLAERRDRWRPPAGAATPLPSQVPQLALLAWPYTTISVELEERLAATQGLEYRCPYLERALVEFSLRTPDSLRRRDGVGKWLHRQAMKNLLPPAIAARQDKAEFSQTFTDALGDVGPLPETPEWFVDQPHTPAWARWSLWALRAYHPRA